LRDSKISIPPLLVTGATGFVGRAFLRACALRQWPVLAVTRKPPSSTDICLPGITWAVSELDRIPGSILASCSALVHLAAAGVSDGHGDWSECFSVNVNQSQALWRAAVAAGIRRFLICGSCFEYGRVGERYEKIPPTADLEPVTAYGSSKAAATVLAMGLAATESLQLTVLRPFQVYGEGEAPHRFWSSLRHAALNGNDFPMTAGEQIRDFINVDFVAEKLADHLANPPPQAGHPVIHNIGTGKGRSLKEFAQNEWERFQATGRLKVGARPMRMGEILRYVPEIT
jgi:UDP-glucose 4-epimerase